MLGILERRLKKSEQLLLASFKPEAKKADKQLVLWSDIIYSSYLCGLIKELTPEFLDLPFARGRRPALYGETLGGAGATLGPHSTAYFLGALRLLIDAGVTQNSDRLSGPPIQFSILFDKSGLPNFPQALKHHTWRVSHWVGGSLAIVYNGKELGLLLDDSLSAVGVGDLISRAFALLDPESGKLKLYESEVLQRIFRLVYRLRHDPDAADIGGFVHLYWLSYANGNQAPNVDRVLPLAREILLSASPFIEKRPYCLDFDILQFLRTANFGEHDGVVVDKFANYFRVLAQYMSNLPDDASMHSITGSLAAYHECALLLDEPLQPFGPRDIIRQAGWL